MNDVRVSPLLSRAGGRGRPGPRLGLHGDLIRGLHGYSEAVAVVIVCSLIAWPLSLYFQLSNVLMVYLLGVVAVSIRHRYGPAVVAVVFGIAAFDFFYVLPSLAFAVPDSQYVVTFVVVLIVALVISNRSMNMRRQTREARQREDETAALYALSRELGHGKTGLLLETAARKLADTFDARIEILRRDCEGRVVHVAGAGAGEPGGADLELVRWVYGHGRMAGKGTDVFPANAKLCLPLIGSEAPLGVILVAPRNPREELRQRRLFQTFANQIALALERSTLAEQAAEAELRVEAERLRNSLLSAISHDLRTPLAAIVGASGSLLENETVLGAEPRRELVHDILMSAQRTTRLVNNVLEIVRLQAGGVAFDRQWYPLEEIVGSVLTRLKEPIAARPVTVSLPETLPWLFIDGAMTEQVLINLVGNALKYTPPGSPIEISAGSGDAAVVVEVADRGGGLSMEARERIFEKFYRANGNDSSDGVGLGLAICRAIVEGQGGTIWAEARAGGGTSFKFTLGAAGIIERANGWQKE